MKGALEPKSWDDVYPLFDSAWKCYQDRWGGEYPDEITVVSALGFDKNVPARKRASGSFGERLVFATSMIQPFEQRRRPDTPYAVASGHNKERWVKVGEDGVNYFEGTMADRAKEWAAMVPRPEEIPMADGRASSSHVDPLEYVPTEAMMRLARRFEAGVERKGDKAWNATSDNQEVLADRAFVLNRISHVIKHAMLLRDKLVKGGSVTNGDFGGDDDAGAVIWGGAFLCCVTKDWANKEKEE